MQNRDLFPDSAAGIADTLPEPEMVEGALTAAADSGMPSFETLHEPHGAGKKISQTALRDCRPHGDVSVLHVAAWRFAGGTAASRLGLWPTILQAMGRFLDRLLGSIYWTSLCTVLGQNGGVAHQAFILRRCKTATQRDWFQAPCLSCQQPNLPTYLFKHRRQTGRLDGHCIGRILHGISGV